MADRESQWDDRAVGYDAMVAWAERRLLTEGRAWVGARAAGDVLEVAIGTGLSLPHYAGVASLTGIDLSREMLGQAASRAARLGLAVDLVHGSATDLPFASGSFDVVTCQYALCGIDDPVAALREMARVLRPGGRLLLADHVGSTNPLLRAAQHVVEAVTIPLEGEHWTRRPLRLLPRAGLRCVESERRHHGLVETLAAGPA